MWGGVGFGPDAGDADLAVRFVRIYEVDVERDLSMDADRLDLLTSALRLPLSMEHDSFLTKTAGRTSRAPLSERRPEPGHV